MHILDPTKPLHVSLRLDLNDFEIIHIQQTNKLLNFHLEFRSL